MKNGLMGFWGMRNIIVGCGLTAALMAATPAFSGVKEGVEAWVAGDYPRAVAEWKVPANGGDADAQFNLGQAYLLGRGVTADRAAAIEWYRKASASGHEQAQAALGLQLFQSGKRDEAMVWLKKAAEAGEARAQYVVGTAYFNGDSLPKDWARAYAFMTRAKASGIGAAANSLVQMDQLVPDQQKVAGLSLAREMERTQQLKSNDAGADSPLTLRSSVSTPRVSTPIGQTSVPASTPPAPVAASTNQPWKAPVVARAGETTPAASSPPTKVAASAPVKATPSVPAQGTVPAKPKPAAIAPSAGGGWKIQLGAFSNNDSAKVAWNGIAAKAGLKALTATYTPVGALTRLQAGPFATRAAADQACSAVKSAGGGCFPVAP